MKLRAWQAIAWLVVVAAAPPVRADDDVEAARAHYRNGTRAYDLGHYAEAASEYELAYRAKDDPALLFNLGQAYRAAGDKVNAIRAFKSYLRRVPDSPARPEVERRILELQQAIELERQTPQKPAASAPVAAPTPPAASTPVPTPRLAPPAADAVIAKHGPATRSTPVYKRWWLWTAVGVVAVGAAVGLGVGLTQVSFPGAQTNGGTFRF